VGSVSFNIVGSLLGQPPWGAEFFSTEGLLARFSGFDDRLLEFVGGGPRSILGFRFFPGGSARALDNLSFNGAQAAVPEPATVLLTASGILALARRRWLTTRPRRSAD